MHSCVKGIDFASFNNFFLLNFGNAPTVWYFSFQPTSCITANCISILGRYRLIFYLLPTQEHDFERLSIYLCMFNELIILTIDDIYSLRRSNKHQTYLYQFHEVPIYTYFNSESVHRYTVSISKITNDMFALC